MLLFFSIRCSNEIIHYVYEATPMKCLILEDTSGQLKLEGWLYLLFLFFYTLFNEEAPFYWQFARGGTILLVILVRRPHFIGSLVNLVGGWWSFFIYVQNYAEGWLEFNFMVHALTGRLVI